MDDARSRPAPLAPWFTDHPASVGESYREHLVHAGGFGLRLVAAGLACLVHALLPAAFPRRASDAVSGLHAQLSRRRAAGEREARTRLDEPGARESIRSARRLP